MSNILVHGEVVTLVWSYPLSWCWRGQTRPLWCCFRQVFWHDTGNDQSNVYFFSCPTHYFFRPKAGHSGWSRQQEFVLAPGLIYSWYRSCIHEICCIPILISRDAPWQLRETTHGPCLALELIVFFSMQATGTNGEHHFPPWVSGPALLPKRLNHTVAGMRRLKWAAPE